MGDVKRFGRYEVRKTLGRGAMGVVYLAEDPIIGRQVAIKVIEAHENADKDELEQLEARFEREFRSAGRLEHPSVVGIYDVGYEDGNPFIAMEYVRGESLQSILGSKRAFTFKEIANLATQLCSALDYAHDFGIVHRDIKPANIMVTQDGRAKIMDFGIARVATTTLTRTGTLIGTPAYMSPEQVKGRVVTGASDQFSLGVMLYHMLSGERPFTAESPTTIMYKIVHEEPLKPSVVESTLPAPVDDVLMRALSKNPADRYAAASEFAHALSAALGVTPADSPITAGVPKAPAAPPAELDAAETVITKAPARARATAEVTEQPEENVDALAEEAERLHGDDQLTEAIEALPELDAGTDRSRIVVGGIAVAAVVVIAFVGWYFRGSLSAPAVPGQLVVNEVPWAYVAAVVDANGVSFLDDRTPTPLSLSLPPGTYTVTLHDPDGVVLRETTIEVGSAVTSTIRPEKAVDVAEYFREAGWQ